MPPKDNATESAATRPETLEQFNADYLRDAIAARAQRLRRLADEVERAAADVDRAAAGESTYGWAAHNVVHTLVWGVANLSVERLIAHATDADIARAKGE